MTTNVKELTPADVLLRPDANAGGEPTGAYVVRKIWHQPKEVPGRTFPDFILTGFTLLDTVSLTDREVSADELQQALDAGTIIPFPPKTVRLVRGLTPKNYHKPNGKIRQTTSGAAGADPAHS